MRWIIPLIGNLLALTAAFGLLARYVPPQVFWPPSIVALLVPGLLGLTALFLLFSLTRRRRWPWAIFPLVVLAFSVPLLDQLFAWSHRAAPALPREKPAVTFVTGNQRLFRKADAGHIDTGRVAKVFRQLQADVVLLQEVWPSTHSPNYINAIQANKRLSSRHQKPGTLIATYGSNLKPVTSFFTPPNEYNGYIVTDVKTDIGTLRVINAHLESNQISGMTEGIRGNKSYTNRMETFARMLAGYGHATRVRAQQADKIRALVETSPYPVVLGGDFNDVPSSYTYNQISSPRLQDAWVVRGAGLGTTFTGPLPGLRIDYFMVDTSLTVVDIERLPQQWSDHRPLRMTVSRSR